MEPIMLRRALASALVIGLAAALSACGGGSASNNMPTPGPQSANMQLLLTDASSDDWATIGVRVLSIALVPQGGGSAVTVWTAPSPAPILNLEQLDQLGEILGNVSVPVGTYSGAILTVGANPGDLLLTVASDPESGFAGTPGATIASNLIQIQGKQGSSGNYTVPIRITFDSPLDVTTTSSNALDLEFDLGHPAFIVAHSPPAAMGATLWAVNFDGPVHRHRVGDLRWLVLRDTYGTVQSVAQDNSSISILRDFAVEPPTNPETEITSSRQLTILADAANGTIFYDVDGKTRTVIKDFSAQAGTLDHKFVRIAARYQVDGSLVAVRIWASSSFNSVWVSPEGHVLHVDETNGLITVENEDGVGVPVAVDANTQFFFRAPQDPAADAAPIGSGAGFLANDDLVRGFKVHVSVADPMAVPMVADSVDIETAAYSGTISGASTTGFTYTRQFLRTSDDYSIALTYLPATVANTDPSGNAIMGFDWWNFTFPTLADTGASAVPDFVSATGGSVNFGGTVGAVSAWGATWATWSTAAPAGWQAPEAVLEPTPLPIGAVVTPLNNDAFTMTVLGGGNPGTVDVTTTAGSATLVYQVDRSNGVVSVSPVDISTSAGLMTLTNNLTAGTPVKVWGIPQPAGAAASGALKAYVLVYFTGMLPTM
ncbi:MAG TPA: DUF4382 domain-containing protein [Steroidobacteraceae bacterium]|nr:DUF4382 domain-containing protein [Steroidobacteraceae bacterium]